MTVDKGQGPEYTESRVVKAAYQSAGREANEENSRRMSDNPRDPEAQAVVSTFWEKADIAAAQGNDEEARAWLEGVVELDQGNAEAWLRLATLVPDAREKMQCYARVLELDPGNPEAKSGLRQARRAR
jgi:tetratricopeptide (TPR) repeat protein